jgi:hypothetical protein
VELYTVTPYLPDPSALARLGFRWAFHADLDAALQQVPSLRALKLKGPGHLCLFRGNFNGEDTQVLQLEGDPMIPGRVLEPPVPGPRAVGPAAEAP